MPVPGFGPLPSTHAAWPAGPCPLSSLSRSVPGSAGVVTEGWSPFLALSKHNSKGGMLIYVIYDFHSVNVLINFRLKC